MRSYGYAHRDGVRDLSWDDFAALAKTLAGLVASAEIDTVVGIARGGLFPATVVAASLRCELYPVRVTRRVNDEVRHARPVWRVPVSADVVGRSIAVIDEIADTGETLAMVAERVRAAGAARVVTACLVDHGWADPRPDFAALVTPAFVIFPWDREVLIDGRWQVHPEIEAGLRAQRDAAGDEEEDR